tara:strand:+ start:775 stop:1347 length:573 start_codon:yes stop_codon:yes gene_type:complete
MYFVLAITALFVLLCVYFFFSAEKLQRKVILQQREGATIRKENKTLSDTMALVSSRHEEFSKSSLFRKLAQAKKNSDGALTQHYELISPLINNYGLIFRECLKGKGRLKATVQKCFNNHDDKAFKQFVALLVTSDKSLKRYWSSNNLNGFLFLVDALLNYDNEPTSPELKPQHNGHQSSAVKGKENNKTP